MVALANIFRLDGVSYIIFAWFIFFFSISLTLIYLQRRGIRLSIIETSSLFTVGMFASVLGLPGCPEILVLSLTLLAVLEFERLGKWGMTQIVCFGLALLTHESAAVLAFGALGLFMFGPRFMAAAALVLALYIITWLLEFNFDISAAVQAQTVMNGRSATGIFRAHAPLAVFSLFAVYKLTLLLAAATAFKCVRSADYRTAALIASALGGALALTYIGIDYSRVVSFATFAVVIAMAHVLPDLSTRQRNLFAAANLTIPSLYVGEGGGVWAFQGLYGRVVGHLFDFTHKVHHLPHVG